MIKNISILSPESEFTPEQLQKLQLSGNLVFADSKSLSSLKDLVKLAKEADVISFDPQRFGKSASRVLSEVLEKSPNVRGLALNSTSTDCVDLDYCRERSIKVMTVMDSTTNAVAEFVFLLLLGAVRRIFVNGWEAQKRMYRWELGSELRGKTLGLVGMGHVGERIAVLAKAFGMALNIWDKDIVRFEGANRQSSMGGALYQSKMVVILLPDTPENKKILSKDTIVLFKGGTIIVNLSGPNLVDEKEMAKALQEGRVDQYIYEAERIKPSPLDKTEHAIAFKKLSELTKESAIRSRTMWVISTAHLAGHPTSGRSL